MKITNLVILSAFLSAVFATFSISRFEGPPFSVKPPSGMYNISGLGFENLTDGNQIIAYGDFNNDKYTDIVTLEDDLRSITVFCYSHDNYTFWPLAQFTADRIVASVIPADYNYDGVLDLLVVTIDATSDPNSHLEYFFQPFTSNDNADPNLSYPLQGQTQPFILDAQGDRLSDLMFIEDGKRIIQTVVDGEIQNKDFEDFVTNESPCKPYFLVSSNTFAIPHSNSFVDLNGDCAADIFITSIDANGNTIFEIWYRNPADSKFCLVDATPAATPTSPISSVSIADMNNDGKLDLIYATLPVNPQEAMMMNIIYNQVVVSASSPCGVTNPPKTTPFPSYSFQASTLGINQLIPMTDPSQPTLRLYSPDPINRPSKIRAADLNIDGYVDLLYVVSDPASSNKYGSIILAMNDATNISINQATSNPEDSVYYLVLDDQTMTNEGDQPLSSLNVQYASFFDFDEIGRLGFWIVIDDETSPTTTLHGVFNYVSSESFMLKTLGLNGVPAADDNIVNSLGGIYYGVSVECRITDINGGRSLSKAAQLPQSAYTPLDVPYVFLGLGRTNNYIEDFVMGIPARKESTDLQQMLWTPIIPNSQLIINPMVNQEWLMDVYVHPTSDTIVIAFITIMSLVILGAVIANLHFKEKREDGKRKPDWIFNY